MKPAFKKRRTNKRKVDSKKPLDTEIEIYRSQISDLAESYPFHYHQELEITIDQLTVTGQGLGMSMVEGKSWPVVVPFSIPGEVVKVKVYREENDFAEADLIEIIKQSDQRIEPICKHFGICSGCQVQHLSFADQMKLKKRIVEFAFEPMKGVLGAISVSEVESSPAQFGYRTKLTPHHNGRKTAEECVSIGFNAQGTRSKVVDIEDCPIATQAIRDTFKIVKPGFLSNMPDKCRGTTYLFRQSQEFKDAVPKVVQIHKEIISEWVGDLQFNYPAGSFFQNNNSILPKFTSFVARHVSSHGLKYLVDAYCGTGLFAIACSKPFDQVVGIEISPEGLDFANSNAKLNNITNCRFIKGDANEIFKNIKFSGDETAVIIDPPRKGSDQDFLRQLVGLRPRVFVYVSCDVYTQVRDLQFFFSETSEYEITAIQPFDLFPQTNKIENIVVLVRK